MACHRFVTHVTGFASFLGIEAARGEPSHAFGMLLVPFFFILGAMMSGKMVDVRILQNKAPQYHLSFGLIFVLILCVYLGGTFGVFNHFGKEIESSQSYLLLSLLCLACGIQNGTVTTVSNSVIRTTHLTGIVTDLGIGIIRLLHRKSISLNVRQERIRNFTRGGIFLCFCTGSIVGAFTFRELEFDGFLFPTLTSGGLFISMLAAKLHL